MTYVIYILEYNVGVLYSTRYWSTIETTLSCCLIVSMKNIQMLYNVITHPISHDYDSTTDTCNAKKL